MTTAQDEFKAGDHVRRLPEYRDRADWQLGDQVLVVDGVVTFTTRAVTVYDLVFEETPTKRWNAEKFQKVAPPSAA